MIPKLGIELQLNDYIAYKSGNKTLFGSITGITHKNGFDEKVFFEVSVFCQITLKHDVIDKLQRKLFILKDKHETVESTQICNIARMINVTVGKTNCYVLHPLGDTALPLFYDGLLSKKTNVKI